MAKKFFWKFKRKEISGTWLKCCHMFMSSYNSDNQINNETKNHEIISINKVIEKIKTRYIITSKFFFQAVGRQFLA